MEKYTCIEVKDKKTRKCFLALPSKLYGDDCPQDRKTEKLILEGRHPLSGDIEVTPFVTVDRQGDVLCRCLLTYYKDDPVAYVGFFEAYREEDAVRTLLGAVERKAIADGKKTLLGPIDASIYIGYRFKVDRFDTTYTGEPYNKDYYPALWAACGFCVRDRYVSNHMRKALPDEIDPRLQRMSDRYIARGYTFISPTRRNFKKCLGDVYESMMALYSSFSGFKPLTKAQYMTLFSPLERVLDLKLVKLAYKDGKLGAFAIALPNYRYLTRGKRTLGKLKKIMKTKKAPDEGVILYVGADKGVGGLGGAVAQQLRNALFEADCSSIGALIKEGNVTGEMYDYLQIDRFHYVLLSKDLTGWEDADGNACDE